MSKDVATFQKTAILKRGDGATPEVFNEVKGCRAFEFDSGGAAAPEKLDVTSHSTSGLVKEKMDGLSDKTVGTLGFELLVDLGNTVHGQLLASYQTGTEDHYDYTVPTKTGTKGWTFTARVTSFPVSSPHDNVGSVKVQLSIVEDTVVAK